MEKYTASPNRYSSAQYKRCGKSGLVLPPLSLGFWHNFGDSDNPVEARNMALYAFDQGINHFDLANNYGTPAGSAEQTVGKLIASDLKSYRDELIITTKAGWDMWPGPFGDFGSRKYMRASLDQSLQRMGLDYVDVYYHHRPDPNTPVEETLSAIQDLVHQGKVLYAGISAYNAQQTAEALTVAKSLGLPIVVNQISYSLLDRQSEKSLLPLLQKEGLGCVAFAPLFQGILTGKYLDSIPQGSRAERADGNLTPAGLTPQVQEKVKGLHQIAQERGEPLAQMALAWLLQTEATSVLLGVRTVEQLKNNLKALESAPFEEETLKHIDQICL